MALWLPQTRGRALILSLSGQRVQVVPRVLRSFLYFALLGGNIGVNQVQSFFIHLEDMGGIWKSPTLFQEELAFPHQAFQRPHPCLLEPR